MWTILDLTSNLHSRASDALDQLARFGFGLLEALIVYCIAWLVSRLVRRPLRRRLRTSFLPENIQALLVNALRTAVFLIATTVLLGVWGLTLSGFLAAVSISTIIVALGFQAALQSFLGGVLILLERPFSVGDRIKFSGQDIEGVVSEIGMRSIILKNDRGERTTAPNALIFTLGVTNLTPNRTRKTIVRVSGIALDSADAREAIQQAFAREPHLPKPIDVRVRTRIVRLHPPFDDLTTDFPASLGRITRSVVSRTRDAEVTWAGVLEAAALESASSILQETFPDSTITVKKG